uniref:Uncharacterized protein n=1 Tax=Ditylum brightwellii TaxID=49249 RepID=A0A7S4RL17_9STRA|mmetsp:Transcript_4515/g.5955  ORF Transcript_4515/g.5955 Transcript_4515/m.5955 type:complete len:586 (+) Transcript_4515:165-1922(+)
MKKALRKSVRRPASQDTAEGKMTTPVKEEEESKTQPASPLSPVLDITSSPSFGNAKDDSDDDDEDDEDSVFEDVEFSISSSLPTETDETTSKKKKKKKKSPMKRMGKSITKSLRKKNDKSFAAASSVDDEEITKDLLATLDIIDMDETNQNEEVVEEEKKKKKKKKIMGKIRKSVSKSVRKSSISSKSSAGDYGDSKTAGIMISLVEEEEKEEEKREEEEEESPKVPAVMTTTIAAKNTLPPPKSTLPPPKTTLPPPPPPKKEEEPLPEVPAMLTTALAGRTAQQPPPQKPPPVFAPPAKSTPSAKSPPAKIATTSPKASISSRVTSLSPLSKKSAKMPPPPPPNAQHDYLFKIVLIGDSNVGKTSLLQRYADNSFPKAHMTTIGVDFRNKVVALESNKVAKLQIWDTAGQERFRSIASTYYRGAEGIFIVYDVTKMNSFQNVTLWLSDIMQSAGVHDGEDDVNNLKRPSVILVGNKNDLKDQRVVTTAQGRDLANELSIKHYYHQDGKAKSSIQFLETSAKTNDSVEECFYNIADQMKIKRELLAQHQLHGNGDGGGKQQLQSTKSFTLSSKMKEKKRKLMSFC